MFEGGAAAKCARPSWISHRSAWRTGHVEKVDRYHGDDRPIWRVDIVRGKERVDDRDIGLDEADPVIGERRSSNPSESP